MRKCVAWIYYLSGMSHTRHWGKVVILTYHRVLPEHELRARYVQPGMYVLDYVFDEQMQFLQENFHILSFRDLLDRWKHKIWDPNERYCVLTFDDGWLDNYLYAYPILKRYRIPSTIFLPTHFIGTSEWFWPEKLGFLLERSGNPRLIPENKSSFWLLLNQFLKNGKSVCSVSPASDNSMSDKMFDSIIERSKQLPVEEVNELIFRLSATLDIEIPEERVLLNWDEIARMSQDGISFGSHSCTHRMLTNVSLTEAKKEIEQSQSLLVEKRINYLPVFCYPNGNYNAEVQNLVKECGYEAAVGAHTGFEGESPQNLFGLKRIGIHNDMTSTIPLFSFCLFALPTKAMLHAT
jgi:peptidoglycan/xylan/chitin deacetylase (PgdA/CDA1 family)